MGNCQVRIIRDLAAWDSIRPAWDDLFVNSPYAAPPLDFDWLRAWWLGYGPVYAISNPPDEGLRIITVWQGTRLVAALPLYLNRATCLAGTVRRLMFISTGEAEYEEVCPDGLGLLCMPEAESEIVPLVGASIESMKWDVLEFLDVMAGSPLLQSRALPSSATKFARGVCPIADLTGGFDAYLERLSQNSRYQARRLLREGAAAAARMEIVEYTGFDAAFDSLVQLHQRRWNFQGKPGVFSAPRFAAFHRGLSRKWLNEGRAVLACLSLEGSPVAVLYGFVNRGKFDFYQSGVAPDSKATLRSPGNLAHLMHMRLLAERGVTAYDFLRGSSSYKQRLATREQSLVGVRAWRRTGRTVTCRCALFVGRSLRTLTRRFMNPPLSSSGAKQKANP